jgi:hypothetical protein
LIFARNIHLLLVQALISLMLELGKTKSTFLVSLWVKGGRVGGGERRSK